MTDDAIQLVSNIMKESTIVEISDDQYQIRRKDVRAGPMYIVCF